MKKVFMILLSSLLLLSMAGIVCAAEPVVGEATGTLTLQNGLVLSDDTIVYYSAEESYTVVIPEFVRFGSVEAQKTVNAIVTAENVVLDDGKLLQVGVKSTHNWNMTKHTTVEGVEEANDEFVIPYSLTYDSVVINGADGVGPHYIMLVPTGTIEQTLELTFIMYGNAPATGTYKDSLEFTISLTDEEVTP